MKAKKIGTIGVDTGHLCIIDPGMCDQLNEWSWYTDNDQFKEIEFPSAISVSTGDGDYPVYAIFDNENELVGVITLFSDDLKWPLEIE